MCAITGCMNGKTKEFQEAVDNYSDYYYDYEKYEKQYEVGDMKLLDYEISSDLAQKNMLSNLRDMSDIYDESQNTKAFDDYLRGRITYEMIEKSIEYDEDNTLPEDSKLIDHIKEMDKK